MKASSFTLLLLCFSDLLPAQVQKKKRNQSLSGAAERACYSDVAFLNSSHRVSARPLPLIETKWFSNERHEADERLRSPSQHWLFIKNSSFKKLRREHVKMNHCYKNNYVYWTKVYLSQFLSVRMADRYFRHLCRGV